MQNEMGGQMGGPVGGMPVEKKSYGALIAVAVILLLIIIGGLYFLGQRMNGQSYNPTNSPSASQSDAMTDSLNSQSDSDSLSSIEADLNATNVDNLDQGAAAMEAEVNAQ